MNDSEGCASREEKRCLQSEMIASVMTPERRENKIHELETELAVLRQELTDGRMRTSQSTSEKLPQMLLLSSGVGKDDIDVSESKKVSLEKNGERLENLSRRLEAMELDNKRLSSELRMLRERQETIEAKVEALEADKVRLEIELAKELCKRTNLTRHEANACSNSVVGCTSGGTQKTQSTSDSWGKDMKASVAIVTATSSELLTKNSCTYAAKCELGVTFTRCNAGDRVFVVWDSHHRRYRVVQDSQIVHVLNLDSVDTLEFWINSDGTPRAKHVLGEVIDKQYCNASKPENRYNMPKGTKFYRVRIKPLTYVS